ncbi:hypothetical protein SERLA73DRAFT_181069 [Serpula lacrymans var. lacrymans S7.3]|uniref:Uncharacterized protein n=1 Tax=Serpula lacrymans var. lacrymans (strain S7.3) TaxID=936435 RepID=F8PUQ6_SERL3|nr:hypothetical protein SERLA73DRAFT_181069 [Serpula lacrymans var. lacrymans S7.3]
MKPREYCCCAIPLVNPGIYATLTEQFVLGVVVATLSVATPEIVGAATPSFAPWLFAIVCYIAAAIQLLGFMGVAQEKPILYRRYVTLHLIVSVAAFAIAIAWVIISATRHSTAQSNCEKKFFPVSGSSSTSSEGQTLCNIFSWVDVGLMGGAWVFFAITQSYFSIVVSSYGSSQRHDHAMYDSLDDSTKPFTNDIAMGDRGDPWDSRPSTDHLGGGRDARGFGHHRNESGASTVMNAPMQKESSEYMDGGYAPTTYPLSDPKGVYTQDPQPTPYGQSYYTGASCDPGSSRGRLFSQEDTEVLING